MYLEICGTKCLSSQDKCLIYYINFFVKSLDGWFIANLSDAAFAIRSLSLKSGRCLCEARAPLCGGGTSCAHVG